MTFHEKLRRRVQEKIGNKAKAARDAGLPESTISSYLSKHASLPRIDIALKIARAIDVPLEWLADDSKDWPPPKAEEIPPLMKVSPNDLMFDVARRHREIALDLLRNFDAAASIDWEKAAMDFGRLPPNKPLPSHIARAVSILQSIELSFNSYRQTFDPIFYATVHHNELPGSDRDVQTFINIDEAYYRFSGTPGLEAFAKIVSDRPGVIAPPERAIFDQHRENVFKFFGATAGRRSRSQPRASTPPDVEIT